MLEKEQLAKAIFHHVTNANREVSRLRHYADNAVNLSVAARDAIHGVASTMQENCIADVTNMLAEGKPIYRGR